MNKNHKLESEQQFRYSIQTLAKMYAMREKEEKETAWSDELREDVLDGTNSAIRHVERQIIQYVLDNYGQAAPETQELSSQAPDVESTGEMASEIVEPEQAGEEMRRAA